MSDLVPQDAIGSLLPLLHRANAVAKKLAEHRYDNEPYWIAEVKIECRHGLLKTEAAMNPNAPPKAHYEIATKIRSSSVGRWFTLDEAELIADRLTGLQAPNAADLNQTNFLSTADRIYTLQVSSDSTRSGRSYSTTKFVHEAKEVKAIDPC